MRLSHFINNEMGRLLNGTNHLESGAISHLAIAAGRAAESLGYLAKIDDDRFKGVWPEDGQGNDAIDDSHVRWAASNALTSLDLAIAAASRLGGFKEEKSLTKEDSIRSFYSVNPDGRIKDKRHKVLPPWREWIDQVIGDKRYADLLSIRNALVHADVFRIIYLSTNRLEGHSLRLGYNVGPLIPPVTDASHVKFMAREIVELSRDVALCHAKNFADTLSKLDPWKPSA